MVVEWKAEVADSPLDLTRALRRHLNRGDLERAIFSPMNQLAGLLWLSVGLRCKSLPREL
jgi:hypothetical protein